MEMNQTPLSKDSFCHCLHADVHSSVYFPHQFGLNQSLALTTVGGAP